MQKNKIYSFTINLEKEVEESTISAKAKRYKI